MKNHLNKISLLLVFLVAVAFSIKSFREPDLWWQIRTGEWILENLQVPKQDVFSYTFQGAEWTNVKWGSEVLLALVAKISVPECVFLLQALVSCLLVFVFFKIAKQFTASGLSFTETLPASIAILLSLIAIEYRIIGRPEMFSHLFTVVFLFLLLRERNATSNKIFWLVPLQIVWANLHEAFGIGIVLTGIFTVGAWLEYFLTKKGLLNSSKGIQKKISALLILQTLSVVINPNGIKLLTKPLNILGQVYENKYTTELFDFRSPEYWQWNVYWAIGVLGVGILGTALYFLQQKAKSNRLKIFVEKFGVGYLLALVAFFYLAATAYRNVVFLVLVFFPLFVFGINVLVTKIVSEKNAIAFSVVCCLSSVVLYLTIVSNKYYELTNSRDRFGLEQLSTNNPVGAADFIKRSSLSGNCFSDYLTSSYLLWKLQPEFKTFIDLRDLDVFPADFFSTFAEAVTFTDAFEKQDSLYHFNYVVLFRPQFNSLHKYLFNLSRFKLAYADAVACVYVPKKSAVDSSSFSFAPVKATDNSATASVVNHLLNPFYKAFDYTKTDNDLLAAAYALVIGKPNEAELLAQKSAANGIEKFKAEELLGQIYYNKALTEPEKQTQVDLFSKAGVAYSSSIHQNADYAQAYLGLGAVYYQQQNFVQALQNFDKAIELDKLNLSAYNFAAECCKQFINRNSADAVTYVEQCIGYYKNADKLNPDNPTILINLGFLYFRKNDCSNATKYLSRVADFQGLSEQERNSAKDCLRKCGSL